MTTTPLTDPRSLIFANLLKGVPIQQVARDFHKSESEINQIFSFVLRKIKSYCFERSIQKKALPIVIASTVQEAQRYRLTCLQVLPQLNLDKAPKYKDILSEPVNPDNIITVVRDLRK